MSPFFMLEKFINYLKVERRYSEHTLLAYRKDIEQFLDCLSLDDKGLSVVHFRDIRSWIIELNENSISNRSINRKISSLRAFFKWLKKEKVVVDNPLAKIKAPKTEKRLPHFAKQSELMKTDVFSDFSDFDKHRDHVIFEMFYQTGIRLSELINLTDKQVQIAYIRVVGKRNKERQIPISKDLHQLVESYKSCREDNGVKGDFLFVLKNGKKLYPKLVYRKINFYLSQVTSLDKRSPHVLRHTFATHMLNNGAGLETLKELLGHANLAATQVYTHNSFAQLSNIYSQAHPRGHKTN
jgi:integrase/recombinase XerC|tara:strand:- start:21379 stop:22266 length:888 start_codon:yes stop_codon:yes gene_type:complete